MKTFDSPTTDRPAAPTLSVQMADYVSSLYDIRAQLSEASAAFTGENTGDPPSTTSDAKIARLPPIDHLHENLAGLINDVRGLSVQLRQRICG